MTINRDQRVAVRCDRSLSYMTIISVTSIFKKEQFDNVELAMENDTKQIELCYFKLASCLTL